MGVARSVVIEREPIAVASPKEFLINLRLGEGWIRPHDACPSDCLHVGIQ